MMYFDDVHITISVTLVAALAYLYSKYQARSLSSRIIVTGVYFALFGILYKALNIGHIEVLLIYLTALILGMLLHAIPLIWMGVIVLFPFTGSMTLSNNGNQQTMFIALIILMNFGFGMYRRGKQKSFLAYLAIINSGLLLYYGLSLILNPNNWLNGLLAGIISLCVGAFFRHCKLGVINLLLPIALIYYYSFYVAPDFDISIRHRNLLGHNLEQFTFMFKGDSITHHIKKDRVIMVETWHQYCNSCLTAMRDLHPVLQDLEYKYDFSHYYAYVGNDMTVDSVYTYPHLPYRDQRVVVDISQDYYRTLGMQGAPYFNFYQNGEYVFSIIGYDARYSDRIKAHLRKKIDKLSAGD